MRNWLVSIVRFFKTGSFKSNDFKFGDTLFFKNNISAFEYFCRYGNTYLQIGMGLPAIVLEQKKDEDGSLRFLLKIASSEGGFLSAASSVSSGKDINIGDLVYWMPIRINEEILHDIEEENNKGMGRVDERLAFIGYIVSILNPAISISNGWSVKKQLSKDD